MKFIQDQKIFLDPAKDKPIHLRAGDTFSNNHVVVRKRAGVQYCWAWIKNGGYTPERMFPVIIIEGGGPEELRCENNFIEGQVPAIKFLLRKWYCNHFDETESIEGFCVLLTLLIIVIGYVMIIFNAIQH